MLALPTRPKTAGKVILLPLDAIQPSPWQARTVFDETEIAALAVSILQNGLLQPVTVQNRRGLSADRGGKAAAGLPFGKAGADPGHSGGL